MEHQRVVCILGMHRSGTSVFSRVLNLLGVYLGPDRHIRPPGPHNPRGYWEHHEIVALNDAIFARLGGSWHEPPAFSPAWETSPHLAELRQQALMILQEDFATAGVWGWKDPRTCLTLPFWQRLLGLRPTLYVICLRNPLDVARSLEARNGFSFEKGVGLWLTYVTAALRHTTGQPRLLVFYEDMMDDWRREVRRLAEFLGTAEPAGEREIEGAVREFLEQDFHHHRATLIDTVNEPRLAFPAKALHVALRMYTVSRGAHSQAFNGEDMMPQAVLDGLGASALEAGPGVAPRVLRDPSLRERRKAVSGLVRTIMYHFVRRDFKGLMRTAEAKIKASSTRYLHVKWSSWWKKS